MRIILNLFNKIYNEKRALMLFIFCFSVLFSVIFLIFFKNIGPIGHQIPGTDYFDRYEPIADNILQGKGIMYRGEVSSYTAPAFPLILAGIFRISQIAGIDKLDLVTAFNVVFTALSALFLFLLAFEIFNKRIALIASLLWATYPFTLWFIKNPNSEVPFITLLYVGIFFFLLALKKKGLGFAFLAGLFLGLASFARIMALFLPVFLGILLFFLLFSDSKKKGILLAAILLIGNLVAIFPWMVYSISKTGGFLSLSSEGPNSVIAGITWLSQEKTGGGKQLVLSDDVKMFIERMKTADPGSGTNALQFFAKELASRPVPLLKVIGLKLGRSWFATSQQWWENQILLVQILYLIPAISGIIYGIKKHRNSLKLLAPLFAAIAYFWGMAFINISILRYVIPAMGPVIIFSAVTINFLMEKLVKNFYNGRYAVR